MPQPDLRDLIARYANTGLHDWNVASADMKRRAQACLGTNRIAEHPWDISLSLKIPRGGSASKLKFLPMPNHPPGSRRGIECSFFLPLHKGDIDTAAFELFLLVEGEKCLAYRLEQPDLGSHDYPHVQMNRQMLGGTLPTRALAWAPESYPAFPTCTKDSLETFLFMLTAVHGYTGGVLEVLARALEGRGTLFKTYVALLRPILFAER